MGRRLLQGSRTEDNSLSVVHARSLPFSPTLEITTFPHPDTLTPKFLSKLLKSSLLKIKDKIFLISKQFKIMAMVYLCVYKGLLTWSTYVM